MIAAANPARDASGENSLTSPGQGRKPRKPGGHGRVGPLAMLFGLVGAPLMWLMQVQIGETLTAQVCFMHQITKPLAPHWPGLMLTLRIISAGALLIGLVATGVAWRNWHATRNGHSGVARLALDTGKGRQRFIGMAAWLLSLLFLVGLVAAGLAVLLVSPCSAWR